MTNENIVIFPQYSELKHSGIAVKETSVEAVAHAEPARQ